MRVPHGCLCRAIVSDGKMVLGLGDFLPNLERCPSYRLPQISSVSESISAENCLVGSYFLDEMVYSADF